MTASSRSTILLSFVAGSATALLVQILVERRKKGKSGSTIDAGATPKGDDLSLFYGDPDSLTTVRKECKFLPKEIYGSIVRDAVICCVDIMAVRQCKGRKECLLVERASEPAKGLWWWPGGRLIKGETFFQAAARQAREETGLMAVKPIQVLGVWNTFFPTSHWDTATVKGTQTVNPIVLVELTAGAHEEVVLDETSENYRWISLDPTLAEADNEDRYVVAALKRLQAWDPRYIHS